MKILIALLLSSVAAFAQFPTVQPINPPGTNGSKTLASPMTLPASWVGTGASWNPSGSPKWTGWVSLATLINASQALYSYSSYDIVFTAKGVPTATARTGLATVVRNFGKNWYILGLATAGVATTGSATTASFAGGGMLVYKFKGNYTADVEFGAQTGATTRTIRVGFGRSW